MKYDQPRWGLAVTKRERGLLRFYSNLIWVSRETFFQKFQNDTLNSSKKLAVKYMARYMYPDFNLEISFQNTLYFGTYKKTNF
jgi:hypothetical protein